LLKGKEMIAFPAMLIEPAKKAGIKIPDNVDDYDKEKFAHFFVFCFAQLGQSMPYPSAHWDNAKIIASFSDEEIKLVTGKMLLEKGFAIGSSYEPPYI